MLQPEQPGAGAPGAVDLFGKADRDEIITVPDFIALTSCQGLALNGGDVIADIDIYNDFVAYLTVKGINV